MHSHEHTGGSSLHRVHYKDLKSRLKSRVLYWRRGPDLLHTFKQNFPFLAFQTGMKTPLEIHSELSCTSCSYNKDRVAECCLSPRAPHPLLHTSCNLASAHTATKRCVSPLPCYSLIFCSTSSFMWLELRLHRTAWVNKTAWSYQGKVLVSPPCSNNPPSASFDACATSPRVVGSSCR